MGYQYSLLNELIVDHFCGGGGASTGIETGLGRIVDIAVNHDRAAIGMHTQNHPYTKHYLKNVFEVDPLEATAGRPVALMWLSPDCTHFSKAKGGTPVKKEIRGLAWLAVKWAAAVRPRVIMLENVPEFKTWCPIKNGQPIKEKIVNGYGSTFKKFVAALKNLGYEVDWREIDASDYGAATTRKRLYLIARCDGKPIVFPPPTHGNKKGLKPKHTAAEFIDFSFRGQSIFTRKKPLATATLRRIARGLDKFTIRSPRPFIVPVAARNGVSSADAPQSPFVMCNNNGNIGTATDEALHTITSGNRHYLTSANLTPYIVPTGYGERDGQLPRINDINDPLGTIVSVQKHNVAAPVLAPYISSRYGDNGATNVRGAAVDNPLPAITAKDHNDLIIPNLIQYHAEQSARENRAYPVTEPINVIDASPRYGLAAAHITKYFGGNYQGAGSAADAPLNTITAVDHNGLVEAHLCILRRNCDCKSLSDPLPTITAAGGHFAEIKTYLTKFDNSAPLGFWDDVRKLLNEYAGYNIAPDEILIIEIDGTPYFISDIEMRMLSPKELYGCQGFPPDYEYTHVVIDGEIVPLSKAEQVKKVGNSVCPPVPRALVAANLPEYKTKKPITTMKELLAEVCA